MNQISIMKNLLTAFALFFGLSNPAPLRAQDAPQFPTFRMVELDEKMTVGYAVLLADVNGEGKKDIVVVDTQRVLWFENPTWKKHVIIQGGTKADNGCI